MNLTVTPTPICRLMIDTRENTDRYIPQETPSYSSPRQPGVKRIMRDPARGRDYPDDRGIFATPTRREPPSGRGGIRGRKARSGPRAAERITSPDPVRDRAWLKGAGCVAVPAPRRSTDVPHRIRVRHGPRSASRHFARRPRSSHSGTFGFRYGVFPPSKPSHRLPQSAGNVDAEGHDGAREIPLVPVRGRADPELDDPASSVRSAPRRSPAIFPPAGISGRRLRRGRTSRGKARRGEG